jgi:hypothetical protein
MSPNVEELVSQAHNAWELFELEQAAELFEAAAVAEKHAGRQNASVSRACRELGRIGTASCGWTLREVAAVAQPRSQGWGLFVARSTAVKRQLLSR